MSRRFPWLAVACAALAAVLAGCYPQQPKHLRDDTDLSHYKDIAQRMDYPDVDQQPLNEVSDSLAPFSLTNKDAKQAWDLTLEKAVQTALANNKVMRSIGGQIGGPPDFIIRNPDLAPTIYDPAIAESNPRTGVEGALAAFDAQFSAVNRWEKYDEPQNIEPQASSIFTNLNKQDSGTMQAQLSKINATGGKTTLSSSWLYTDSNNPLRNYPASWGSQLRAEVRQPLLQGGGVQFNRIAGPGATPGLYGGVLLARINADISLCDFQLAVRTLVSDVEIAYWEVYYNYRNLDAVIAGRDAGLQTWRQVHEKFKVGTAPIHEEAQARAQYFLFRSAVERALTALYQSESKLRYLMGLATTDGRLIRPADEPTTAKVTFDWGESLCEALSRSTELREWKWLVKRRELEFIASKNFLLPKLDLVAAYQWQGLGERLLWGGSSSSDYLQHDSNAVGSMLTGKYQNWVMGAEFSMPLGFRRENAGVRNAELALVRERVRMQEAELELSHQLAYAIRELESTQTLAQTVFNRRVAARDEVRAAVAKYEAQVKDGTLTNVLDAQRRLAEAESDYYRTLVDYNKAIVQVHLRKGSLLEYNGVYLAEGPWPAKAYFDAARRARSRAAGMYLDYGFTYPKVMSRGPIEQGVGDGPVANSGEHPTKQGEFPTEAIPTPAAAPLVPEAAKPAPELSPADGNVQKTSATIRVSEAGVDGWAPAQRNVVKKAGKGLDVGTLDLNGLEVKQPAVDRGSTGGSSAVVPTGFSDPAVTDKSSVGWKKAAK